LKTFDEAYATCDARGGRLCTWDELAARETQGTGCGYDATRVWTISECAEDSFWTGPGNPDNMGAIPKQCTAGVSTAYVRCCADFADCCPYKCQGDDCGATCADDSDCCSDSYCKSNACLPEKANGQTCAGDNECTSGKCVDGYCCDGWCNGTCRSCAQPGKEGECTNYAGNTDPEDECQLCNVCNGYGACTKVGAGEDPVNDCAQQAQSTCGLNGDCDGAGQCELWNNATICAVQNCTDHVLNYTDYCNGTGSCTEAGSEDCCPYSCLGNACRTSCSSDSHCCAGNYCVGTTCVETKPNGETCAGDSQCASGNCVDGYCCNTPCGETCKACNVVGLLGTCSFVPAATDPLFECGTCRLCNGSGACVNVAAGQDPLDQCLPEAPCGQDGLCDGAGDCRVWAMGTECAPQSCSGATIYYADECNGSGLCANGGEDSCVPYKCSGNSCANACATDNDCVAGFYCSASVCLPKKGNGEVCGSGGQCLSGYCVDGVCCDSTCTGTCRGCNFAGFVGVCVNYPNNADPQGECGTCKACNGGGACKLMGTGLDPLNHCAAQAQSSCGTDGMCDGAGACRKWSSAIECGAESCVGTTHYPADVCSGTGSCSDSGSQSCCPFKCGAASCLTSCTANSHCCSDSYCNGSECVTKKANGSTCAEAGDCASGLCVDGYCCNSACSGTCQACDVGGSEGSCTPLAVNVDPDNECGTCKTCNGASGCQSVGAGQDPKGQCNQVAASTCGQDGNCDGGGACRMWPAGTVCSAQSCSDGVLANADTCDGSGVCVEGGESSCCPYACSGNSCLNSCTNISHCCSGFFCSGGACVGQKENGETCGAAQECISGNCVDGYCCNTACAGTCESCSLPGFEGGCTFVGYLSDPHGDCPTCQVCSGAGGCTNTPDGVDPTNDCPQQATSTCAFDGVCNGSGACRYWDASTICGSQTCNDHTFAPSDFCNGGGSCLDSGSVDCCPFSCFGDQCGTQCTSDTACCPTALCKSNQQCQTCSTAKPCAKGGYCCFGDDCITPIETYSPPDSNNVNDSDATFYGSTYGGNNEFNWNGGNNGGFWAKDRVYHFHTKNDTVGMQLQIKVWGNFDSILYMRRGSCGGGGTDMWYNDDGCNLGKGSCLTQKLIPGQDWWVYVDGFSTQSGDYTIQFDFTSLCGNCVCDSAYGENQTNNPVECYESGDYCGNHIKTNFTTHPQTKYFYDNLAGDHDDFSPYGSWAWGNCWFCTYCKPHGHYDKIYRFNLPWTTYVSVYYNKNGGWSPNNYPRMMIYKGADFCKNGTGQKMLCRYSTNNEQSWGWNWSSPTTWSAGTYWIVTDMYYEQAVYTAPYRLIIKTWNASSGHL